MVVYCRYPSFIFARQFAAAAIFPANYLGSFHTSRKWSRVFEYRSCIGRWPSNVFVSHQHLRPRLASRRCEAHDDTAHQRRDHLPMSGEKLVDLVTCAWLSDMDNSTLAYTTIHHRDRWILREQPIVLVKCPANMSREAERGPRDWNDEQKPLERTLRNASLRT